MAEGFETLRDWAKDKVQKISKIKLNNLSSSIVVVLKHFVHERECLVIILTLFDLKCSKKKP